MWYTQKTLVVKLELMRRTHWVLHIVRVKVDFFQDISCCRSRFVFYIHHMSLNEGPIPRSAQTCHTQLKILGGAPEDFRGERWATGDYSGRLGEEAHSPICPLKLPDKILAGDLWWEQLRGPQWEKLTVGRGRDYPL